MNSDKDYFKNYYISCRIYFIETEAFLPCSMGKIQNLLNMFQLTSVFFDGNIKDRLIYLLSFICAVSLAYVKYIGAIQSQKSVSVLVRIIFLTLAQNIFSSAPSYFFKISGDSIVARYVTNSVQLSRS